MLQCTKENMLENEVTDQPTIIMNTSWQIRGVKLIETVTDIYFNQDQKSQFKTDIKTVE